MDEFKDRSAEVTELTSLINSNRFELLVIYGRRRIGKTTLILHIAKNKRVIYFLAERYDNVTRFQGECAKIIPQIGNLKADFGIILENLINQVDGIIIDEFQNMLLEEPNIANILQRLIDGIFQQSKLKLILLGSSVSLMTSKVLSDPSPLFGRKTAALKLGPVAFPDLPTFFPNATFQELVEIYGFADGIPFYLTMIDLHHGFWDWLQDELMRKVGFLKGEIDFLLRYEFSKPEMFMRILEAIALGRTKANHIADSAKMKVTDLPPYLHTLIQVDFVKREVPLLESALSKQGRYYLKDNFVRFWFRFIFPNLSSIEQGIFDVNYIKNIYSGYLGYIFETVVKQILVKSGKFPCDQLGRWWKNAIEMDIVAHNRVNDEWLFGECKYSHNVNAKDIVVQLVEKLKNFPHQIQKHRFLIVALSFEKVVNDWEGKTVWCWDANELNTNMMR